MGDGAPQDDYFVSVSAQPPPPPAVPPPGAGVRPSSGPSIVTVVAALVGSLTVALGAGLWLAAGATSPLAPAPDPGVAVAEVDDAPARGAPPDPAVDGYAVWARNADGSPVRWNPCEPIRWALNPDGAPPGAELDLTRAIGEVTAASGLRFRYVGTTDEAPTRERSPYQPERYGRDTWAPILVAWARPAATDVPLAATDRGVAIPVAVGDDEHNVFVSGQIVLNPDRPLSSGFEDRRSSWGATLLHELGHAVGLDHVDDPRQLMHTYPGEGPARFSSGDLAGLRELGAGGCVDVPDPIAVDVDYVDDFGG